jgi:hypothetical protein
MKRFTCPDCGNVLAEGTFALWCMNFECEQFNKKLDFVAHADDIKKLSVKEDDEETHPS